jgi:fibronectin type 3 domain-containing protein
VNADARACLLVLMVACLAAPTVPVDADTPGLDVTATSRADAPSIVPPVAPDAGNRFTENLGQWDERVAFVADSAFGRAGFCPDGVLYDVVGPEGGHRVKVSFDSGTPLGPVGVGDLGFPTCYFIGDDQEGWVRGARSYREVVYADVWPGIDVKYYHSAGDLKYDILVGADADPGDVRFQVSGAEGLRISPDAIDIRLSKGLGLRDRDLVAWYEDGEPVDVRFEGDGDTFGLDLDKEPGRRLVIDPVVVHSSTLIGGIYDDTATTVELDSVGNLVVASYAGSTDFPVTEGAYDDEASNSDVAITKLNHNASRIIWSTFVGGSLWDYLSGMDIDDRDDVYFAGQTWSSDFPTTEGAVCPEFNLGMNDNQLDPFVTKLNSEGNDLIYSTYLGGSSTEWLQDIKVHRKRAAVVGSTHSYDFPTEYGSYGGVHGDAFLVIMAENGTAIEDTHFWGGFGSEALASLEFDKNGDIVVGGGTTSLDMPTTPGVIQPHATGFNAGFVARYSPSKDAIVMQTYFGGGAGGSVGAVTVDDDLNVYISGRVQPGGTGEPFPTPGAFDREVNGWADAYLAKVSPDATRLYYCTLLGGDGDDEIVNDLAVDGDGNLVAVGSLVDGTNFTVTSDAHDPDWAGESEGFIFVLNPQGYYPVYSSFLGGRWTDSVNDVLIDDVDNWVIAGGTDSMDMPVNESAFQRKLVGGTDSFCSIVGDLLPTSEPRELVATGGEGYIQLDWAPPEDDNGYPVKRYLLYRGLAEDGMHFYKDVGADRSYVDEEVEWGVYYHYALYASNGKGISPRSNEAHARSVTVPARPINFTAVAGLEGVTLSWEPPSFTGGLPLTGFVISRTDEIGLVELVTPVGANDTSILDALVEDGMNYTYAITARNEYGESRELVVLTVRTVAVPSPPVGLGHTYGDLYIRVTWRRPLADNGLPVTGYIVHRAAGDGPFLEVARTGAKDRAYNDTDVEVAVMYTYRVVAENARGTSVPSVAIQAMAMVPPDPPVEVQAVAMEHFVRVTWSPSPFDGASPIMGYRVYLGEPGNDAACLGGPSVDGLADPQLVFLHDVAYDGVVRSYFVTAVNAEGESGPSIVASTTVYQAPEPPGEVRAEWGDGKVEVSWDPSPSDGGTPVRLYTLYRLEEGQVEFVLVLTLYVDEGTYLDLDVENGIEFSYRVTATNLVGESEPSPGASAVPAGPPGVPIGILAEGDVGMVRLTWSPPDWNGGHPVSGYTIYRSTDGGEMEVLLELDGDTLEIIDEQVEAGTVYMYTVTAHTDAGTSPRGEMASAMPYGPPGAPTGLAASRVEGRVQLSWSVPLTDGGRAVTGYWVHRDDRDEGNLTQVPAALLSLLDDQVEPGTTYNYTVYACNAAGMGPGTTVTFTVPPPEPPAPESPESSEWPFLSVAIVLLVVAGTLVVMRGRGGLPGQAIL